MYEKPRLRGEWFIDTLDGQVISKYRNRYSQVFANIGFFAHIYPMDTERKAGYALRTFCQEFGFPDKLTFDGSKEQGQRKTGFMKKIRMNDIDLNVIKPDCHNQNCCEGVMRKV